MFVSFFPRPRAFFISVLVWLGLAIGLWYLGGRNLGAIIGLPPTPPDAPPIIGVSLFWSKPFLWFDIYFWAAVAIFAGFWRVVAPHPWARWSIWGSALIVFATYLQVEVSVVINRWYVPFWDLIQAALAHTRHVTQAEYFAQLATFAYIAVAGTVAGAFIDFFTSHYVFRWRTAMNGYYVENWPTLRNVEGASQRIQEDTMRFSTMLEDLGGSFVNSIMTLIAFLPILVTLSLQITALPLVGRVPQPLVLAAIFWALFGTTFLALIGVRLPGLEFRNQRVEAAYRKELVYGEDDAARAQPPTLKELFANVRRNYFRLYFNYLYFNVGRYFYLQVDNIFGYFVLGPTVVAGVITLGFFQQALNVFDQVRSSFQYLVNSWTTIVDLISVYKRLRGFEAMIAGEALPALETAT